MLIEISLQTVLQKQTRGHPQLCLRISVWTMGGHFLCWLPGHHSLLCHRSLLCHHYLLYPHCFLPRTQCMPVSHLFIVRRASTASASLENISIMYTDGMTILGNGNDNASHRWTVPIAYGLMSERIIVGVSVEPGRRRGCIARAVLGRPEV